MTDWLVFLAFAFLCYKIQRNRHGKLARIGFLMIVFFSLRKHPFLLRSTPLGTFREKERPQRRRAKEKRMLSQATSSSNSRGVLL